MRPSIGLRNWSMTYPDTLGARKKPTRLKKTCPKDEEALYCSLCTLEMMIPKQVGTIAAPKASNSQNTIVNVTIS